MNQLMFIKKNGRENLWVMLGFWVVLMVNTCWYIYGNVIYFNNNDECTLTPASGDTSNLNNDLANAMWFMIMIGYITICKCCLISTFAAIAIPLLITMMRRQNQPDWAGAAPDLLRDLTKGKYKPPEPSEDNEERPEDTAVDAQCIICFVDYTEQDTIITLPCDKRHFFHEDCITDWLKKNNTCPLCKKAITKEAL